MRKIIVSNMTSVDGYFAGLNGELDWHHVDNDFINYASEMLDAASTLLFGRVTYELMSAFWPTASAEANDPVIAPKMNALEKFVFSTTMESADWENTTLVRGDLETTVNELKQQQGKNIVILGSGKLIASLMQYNLIDEFFIIENPIILGAGKPLFTKGINRTKLQLIDVKPLQSGAIILHYQSIH